MKTRIGILTGGGDCPGLNAVIRAVVRCAVADENEVLGIKNGWQGLIEGEVEPLDRNSITGILPRGGTILGTSRFNPLKNESSLEKLHENWGRFGLDALVVVGGDGSLSAALEIVRRFNYPIVAVPKTIDNDICGTDFSFGFDTAVGVVTDAVDRLHSTAESHHCVMVVEVMGRHSGWIAAYGGIAGGADVILVPEHPFRISRVCSVLLKRLEQGRAFSIIVVAEDAHPHPDENFLSSQLSNEIFQHERLGGIGNILGREIEKGTGIETRVTKLGYIQRGGSPSPFDRVLATRFGVKAYEMVIAHEWGRMTSLQGTTVTSVPIEAAGSKTRPLDEEIFRVAEMFLG